MAEVGAGAGCFDARVSKAARRTISSEASVLPLKKTTFQFTRRKASRTRVMIMLGVSASWKTGMTAEAA